MRLILIRHCKSDWSGGEDDHDRPLNARGRESAAKLGGWLAALDLAPDLWLVSTALRTQQTAAGLRERLDRKGAKRDERSLYMAMPGTIIDLVAAQDAGTLALVSHNPGIGMAADMLAQSPPDHARFADYPTGAITVLEFDEKPARNSGRVLHFVMPRDL